MDFVTAPVAVRDPAGEIVLNLSKNNFHVYDNGAEQKIEHFDLGGDPLSVVLAVETSSHIEPMLPAIRKTGIIFTATVMALTSEAAVVGFDDDVTVLHAFTTDPDAVQSVVGDGLLPEGSSGSHVYDAMARGISLLAQRPVARRRILVVVGEAQDTGSENKLGAVLRSAQLANVTIYSIGLSTAMADLRAKKEPVDHSLGPPGTYPIPTPPGNRRLPISNGKRPTRRSIICALAKWLVKTGMNAIGPNSLAVASKATGGLLVNAKRDSTHPKSGGRNRRRDSRAVLARVSSAADVQSGYHEIKVTVDRDGVSVRTRPGYYLPPPPAD